MLPKLAWWDFALLSAPSKENRPFIGRTFPETFPCFQPGVPPLVLSLSLSLSLYLSIYLSIYTTLWQKSLIVNDPVTSAVIDFLIVF